MALVPISTSHCWFGRIEDWTDLGFIDKAASFRFRECLDPLNTVFGLLGLASDFFRGKIHLDYNLSPREVYTNVAVAVIAETRTLNVLSYVYRRRHIDFGIPPYVPDFTAIVPDQWNRSHLARGHLTADHYNACLRSTAYLYIHTSGEATAQVVSIDGISDAETDVSTTSLKQRLYSWHKIAKVSESSTLAHDSLSEPFWHTLCGSVFCFAPQRWDWFRAVNSEDYPSFLRWQDWVEADQSIEARTKETLDLNSSAETAFAERKMVRTTKGFISLAPEGTELGDMIVVMPGGIVPYVLRHFEGYGEGGPRKQYQFIGDV